MRTRVGYCGGTKPNPTYRSLGDHTETVEMDFDPTVITYRELVKEYFAQRIGCGSRRLRQYASIIFWHDDEQRREAEAGQLEHQRATATEDSTEIVRYERFWLAEDYHQKYSLRSEDGIAREMLALYPRAEDFVNSTAAMRLNAWLGGEGEAAQIRRDLPRVGLSNDAQRQVRRLTRTDE